MIQRLFGTMPIFRTLRILELRIKKSSGQWQHQATSEEGAGLERRIWGILSVYLVAEFVTVREVTQGLVGCGRAGDCCWNTGFYKS